MEQELDDGTEADTKDEEHREGCSIEFEYTANLHQKTGDGEKNLEIEERREGKQEMGQHAEKETNEVEYHKAWSESDDAESIVDALLARYTT